MAHRLHPLPYGLRSIHRQCWRILGRWRRCRRGRSSGRRRSRGGRGEGSRHRGVRTGKAVGGAASEAGRRRTEDADRTRRRTAATARRGLDPRPVERQEGLSDEQPSNCTRLRARAGEVLPPHPTRRAPRPVRVAARRGRHRRDRPGLRPLLRRRRVADVRRPDPPALRRPRVRRHRWPQDRRVAPRRDQVDVALDRRATPVPPPHRQAPTGGHALVAGRRGAAASVVRPRVRRGHGPRPARRDADRHRRRHPPGVHPARPHRAAAPGHELGPRARHRLPLRAHRLLAGDGADPARLRQGPRRVVVPARPPRRLVDLDDVRRTHQPRRTRRRASREHRLDLPRHEGRWSSDPGRRWRQPRCRCGAPAGDVDHDRCPACC